MRENNKNMLLYQNEEEAKAWLVFLDSHWDAEELKSLEDEISDRLFAKYDVLIERSKLDDMRVQLMKRYIEKSNKVLNTSSSAS